MPATDTDDIQVDYYVRGETTLTREAILGERWIRWAYQSGGRGLVAKLLFSTHLVSKLMGWWFDSEFSVGKIQPTIAELEIDESEFSAPTQTFRTFNDFFHRRLKSGTRPFDPDDGIVCSPADGRVLVYPKLKEDTLIPVKGCDVALGKLLAGDAHRYHNGAALMVRLCPADYHRFHFPCAGTLSEPRWVAGGLHSVNPIALASGIDVFCENHRCVTEIQSDTVGRVAYVEVGAFGVGGIVHTVSEGTVAKMDEKGYFKFGGSSLVLLFEPERIQFSNDLIKNSAEGYETLVRVGETIATCKT